MEHGNSHRRTKARFSVRAFGISSAQPAQCAKGGPGHDKMSRAGTPGKRFAVDIMLGKLAKWLRALGFDARSMPLDERARIDSLVSEGYIPVTRREKFRHIEGVIFIRDDHQFEQLKELMSTLELGIDELRPFSRCGRCNAELVQIPREAAFGA